MQQKQKFKNFVIALFKQSRKKIKLGNISLNKRPGELTANEFIKLFFSTQTNI